jgi:hypothetical protein
MPIADAVLFPSAGKRYRSSRLEMPIKALERYLLEPKSIAIRNRSGTSCEKILIINGLKQIPTAYWKVLGKQLADKELSANGQSPATCPHIPHGQRCSHQLRGKSFSTRKINCKRTLK